MPTVIRHYHGLIACTISVFTLQPPWNLQLQQQEQTPCSQQIQISQNQNKTGFSSVLFAAVYPKIGELLKAPPSEPYKQTLLQSEATYIQCQPRAQQSTFSAQREIVKFIIITLDLKDFPLMQGMLNSLVKGFVRFVVFFMSLILLFKPDLCKQDSTPAVITACTPRNQQTGLQTHQGEQLSFKAHHVARNKK